MKIKVGDIFMDSDGEIFKIVLVENNDIEYLSLVYSVGISPIRSHSNIKTFTKNRKFFGSMNISPLEIIILGIDLWK